MQMVVLTVIKMIVFIQQVMVVVVPIKKLNAGLEIISYDLQ